MDISVNLFLSILSNLKLLYKDFDFSKLSNRLEINSPDSLITLSDIDTINDSEIQSFISELFKYQSQSFSTILPIIHIFNGCIIYSNKKFYNYSGLTESSVLGRHISYLFPFYQINGIVSNEIVKLLSDDRNFTVFPVDCQMEFNGELKPVSLRFNRLEINSNFCVTEIVLFEDSVLLEEINNLKLSESKYKTIAENTPGLTKISNVNNLYYHFNKNWHTFLNLSNNDELSKVWLDYVHPEDISKLLRTVDYSFKRKSQYRVEYRLRNSNNIYFLFEDYGEPVFDDKLIFIGYVSTAVDITDAKNLIEISNKIEIQRLVEEEIRRNIELTQRVIVGISKSNKLVFANSYTLKILSYLTGETNMSFNDIFHCSGILDDDIYTFFTKNVGDKIQATTLNLLNINDSPIYTYIFTAIYIGSSYSSESNIIYLIGEDITEVQNQKKSLIKKEEKLQDVLNSMQDLYFKIDKNFVLIEANLNSKVILGYDADQIIGHSVKDKVIQMSKSTILFVIKNRTLSNVTIKILDKDGNRLFFNCKIKLVLDDNKQLYFVGVARDITDILKTQINLMQKNKKIMKLIETKDQFLANMSHEIRTPLNGIIGLIDLLSSSKVIPSPQIDFIHTIKNSSKTLLRIINDILDLSKLEADSYTLRNTTFNLKFVIDGVLDLYQPLALEKNIYLLKEYDTSIPSLIYGDQIRLTQILGNLISNSIKFTYTGGVTIRVMVISHNLDKTILEFLIKDTGIGINSDAQNKLFKAFVQLDSSNSKVEQGTGLGLHISKKIIHLMDGSISFTSKLGVGSEFKVIIPFSSSNSNAIDLNPSIQNNLINEVIFKSLKVLVVDDNSINITVASNLLSHLGCEVTTCLSPLIALDKLFSQKDFNAIFMDIQMPHIDGVQALKLIQITPFCHVPIFALTAYSMSGDKLKYLKLGFTGYLPKPITLSSLQSLFNEYSDSLIHLNSIGELQYYNSKQVYDLVSIIGYETYALTANEFLNEFSTYCSDLKVIDKSLFLKFLHTVKGSSATIGFEQLSVVSEFLETVYLETNFTEYSDSISLLATILNESIRFLHIFESEH